MAGHPMSGIGELELATNEGVVRIPCDRNETSRALIACFGRVSVIGKKIWYRVDSIGVLETIGPVK
jgi:hypothetical protein